MSSQHVNNEMAQSGQYSRGMTRPTDVPQNTGGPPDTGGHAVRRPRAAGNPHV